MTEVSAFAGLETEVVCLWSITAERSLVAFSVGAEVSIVWSTSIIKYLLTKNLPLVFTGYGLSASRFQGVNINEHWSFCGI